MPEFGWRKSYLKEGFKIFSPGGVALLRNIQEKYSEDYIPFLMELSGTSDVQNYKYRIKNLADTCRLIVQDIGAVLGREGRPATKEHIERLYKNMSIVDEEVQFFKTKIEESSIFAQNLATIQAKTGTSLNEFKTANVFAFKRLKEFKPEKEGFGRYTSRVAPELTQTVKGLGTGLLTAVTGPFAPIARMAVEGITGIVKDIREKKIRMRERALSEILIPRSKYSPEESFRRYRQTFEAPGRIPLRPYAYERELGGMGYPRRQRYRAPTYREEPQFYRRDEQQATVPERFPYAEVPEEVAPPAHEVPGVYEPRTSKKISDIALKQNIEGLRFFYDKVADKVKWTREVKELLEKIAKRGVEEKGGLFGILPMATLTTIGGAVAAIATAIGSSLLAREGMDALLEDLSQAEDKIREWFWIQKGDRIPKGLKAAGYTGALLGGVDRGALDYGITKEEAVEITRRGGKKGFGLGYTGAVNPMATREIIERQIPGMTGKVVGATIPAMQAFGPAASAFTESLMMEIGHLFGGEKIATSVATVGDKIDRLTKGVLLKLGFNKTWEGKVIDIAKGSGDETREMVKEWSGDVVSALKKFEGETVKVLAKGSDRIEPRMETEFLEGSRILANSIQVLTEGTLRTMEEFLMVLKTLVPRGSPLQETGGMGGIDSEVSLLSRGNLEPLE